MRKRIGGSAVKGVSSRDVPDTCVNTLGGSVCDEVKTRRYIQVLV
eukprot:CAMPEP_0184291006 /NCGR_PEP_ID=MMETSP1049-20130417/3120_1 /TAXON_ID=77928 /ORGANISM="Proteomonas sulcata, Strain CCMP704" /LENGTH=44 /DNA_ID= /DNA_START= /DNA_END= /DNA_ORIENTATION=